MLRLRKSQSVDGIEIRGGADFQRRTREAIALLRPLAAFELVRAHLAVIRQGQRSGVQAWARKPIFTVATATWNHSALWYAGAIAHDAFHAKLYRDAKQHDPARGPSADAWSGKAAERACLAFQSQVLLALNADKAIIAHIEKHAKNPTYQGRNQGWGSWLDYRKRWW
ncbi:MAG: hypothetical protein ACREQ2_02385 [Candidatus Binatia bacterium]